MVKKLLQNIVDKVEVLSVARLNVCPSLNLRNEESFSKQKFALQLGMCGVKG